MAKAAKVVRKNMRLRQDLIDRAKRILGTKTETETVEQALEMVAFREEVVEGIEAIAGSNAVEDVFQDNSD
jgi:Arc/MetJ family transcription regulator